MVTFRDSKPDDPMYREGPRSYSPHWGRPFRPNAGPAEDAVVALLHRSGIAVTRQNYLDLSTSRTRGPPSLRPSCRRSCRTGNSSSAQGCRQDVVARMVAADAPCPRRRPDRLSEASAAI
jgi:hypothetical protein